MKKIKDTLKNFISKDIKSFIQKYMAESSHITESRVLKALIQDQDLYYTFLHDFEEKYLWLSLIKDIDKVEFEYYVATENLKETFKHELPKMAEIAEENWVETVKQYY